MLVCSLVLNFLIIYLYLSNCARVASFLSNIFHELASFGPMLNCIIMMCSTLLSCYITRVAHLSKQPINFHWGGRFNESQALGRCNVPGRNRAPKPRRALLRRRGYCRCSASQIPHINCRQAI
jgi:hypothetical protein